MEQQKTNKTVPYLPLDVPFNDDQKQWLGGFLAGLHTRLLMKEESVSSSIAPQQTTLPLTIIYGSQTGNAEAVAYDAAEMAKNHGLLPSVFDMDDFQIEQLSTTERLLVITSTYGEGEMPDNAQALWDAIQESSAPSLTHCFYSVLALGDTNYDDFCLAGIQWDERLQALGAKRIANRVDCDVAFEAPAEAWMAEVIPTIAQKGSDTAASETATVVNKKPKSKYNRDNPLKAELITKRMLNHAESDKETLHYEFSIADSGEQYDAGDALNIIPVNRPSLVEGIINRLAARPEQQETFDGITHELTHILTYLIEIRTPSKELIVEIAKRSACQTLAKLLEDNASLSDYLWGKDTLDVLNAYPDFHLSAGEFIQLSKPLAPRAYSISSSQKMHNDEVHLTVASVRYQPGQREHHGVCSTYLADLAEVGEKVNCYFTKNKHFSIPADPNAPMIMIGPGTGIAPFRAFLEERSALSCGGENWLFFGDRRKEYDYLYQEEIETMLSAGFLTRLDLAFSRDQDAKVYVQDKMKENSKTLFEWLEKGAYLFICGDAFRMAKDVDKALHEIVIKEGKMNQSQAESYIAELKKQKRYVRDVY